jgi:hypothetical protein
MIEVELRLGIHQTNSSVVVTAEINYVGFKN